MPSSNGAYCTPERPGREFAKHKPHEERDSFSVRSQSAVSQYDPFSSQPTKMENHSGFMAQLPDTAYPAG